MLHGLGDEYGCDGGYSPISDPKNIFDSLVACESAADAAGLDKTQCIQIDDENAPGTLCATPH